MPMLARLVLYVCVSAAAVHVMTATTPHPSNGKMVNIMMADATAAERVDVQSPAPRQASQDASGCMDNADYRITISSAVLPRPIEGGCAEVASVVESLSTVNIKSCDSETLLQFTDLTVESQFDLISNCPVGCNCPGLATINPALDTVACPGLSGMDSIGYPCPEECCMAPCCPVTCPTQAALDDVNNDDDPDNNVPPNDPSSVCSECGVLEDGSGYCCSICIMGNACLSACAE